MAGEEIAKYALNSTIGTNDFKPLNEFMARDMVRLIPSDNLFDVKTISINDKFYILNGIETLPFTRSIRLNNAGVAKMVIDLSYMTQHINSDNIKQFEIKVFRNGVLISSFKKSYFNITSSTKVDIPTIITISDFAFDQGDVITAEATMTVDDADYGIGMASYIYNTTLKFNFYADTIYAPHDLISIE